MGKIVARRGFREIRGVMSVEFTKSRKRGVQKKRTVQNAECRKCRV